MDLAERFAPKPWEERETAIHTKEDEDLARYFIEGIGPKPPVEEDDQIVLPHDDSDGAAQAAPQPPQ
jgi:hypothetical protein